MSITKETSKDTVISLAKDCRMCGHCCRYGTGYLIGDDLKNIADHLDQDEQTIKEQSCEEVYVFGTPLLKPKILDLGKPFGRCIFLQDDNTCKVHQVKPFMCRIGTCNEHGAQIMEWFYLNYAVKPYDPASLSEWDARIRTHPTIKGGATDELVPDKDTREQLLKLQKKKE